MTNIRRDNIINLSATVIFALSTNVATLNKDDKQTYTLARTNPIRNIRVATNDLSKYCIGMATSSIWVQAANKKGCDGHHAHDVRHT
jgi:soluble lytic murein transglycosylase-like protein